MFAAEWAAHLDANSVSSWHERSALRELISPIGFSPALEFEHAPSLGSEPSFRCPTLYELILLSEIHPLSNMYHESLLAHKTAAKHAKFYN